jgi:hypothetical protein
MVIVVLGEQLRTHEQLTRSEQVSGSSLLVDFAVLQ